MWEKHFLINGRSWLKATLSNQKIFIWLISAACSGASTIIRGLVPNYTKISHEYLLFKRSHQVVKLKKVVKLEKEQCQKKHLKEKLAFCTKIGQYSNKLQTNSINLAIFGLFETFLRIFQVQLKFSTKHRHQIAILCYFNTSSDTHHCPKFG